MTFTEEMINEDEKRWHARDVVTELGYCGNYMRDRKDMKNIDIRFYAYIMRKAYYMLKEQEPKTPIHIHEEYPEHDWETDEDGNIDEFAMAYGFHNGPACKRCGYSFCEHCKPNGWNEEPCVIDYYQCPKCGKSMCKGSENIVYCEKCGQAVKWND